MKIRTKSKFDSAYKQCESEGRSAAYTIQFLQDCLDVDFDCAVYYMEKYRGWDEDVHGCELPPGEE